MKKWIVFALFISAPALIFAADGWGIWSFGMPIRGNANIISSERPVSAFHSIRISGNATVYFHVSPEYRAVVSVDSNLDEHARVYTDNGVLRIGTRRGRNYSFTRYTVEVYAPSLSAVTIYGAGRFEGRDTIVTSSFMSNVSGFGKIEGSFESDFFSAVISGSGDITAHAVSNNTNVRISGSGSVRLTGRSDEINASISGSGDLLGREFQTNNADLRISGSGRVNIWVLETLRANISGSGRVTYRGNPRIDFRGSGTGRIQSE